MIEMTNIVYLTTKCNLACTYCYQHVEDYPHKETSIEELKKIAYDIISREGFSEDIQTSFVLFGGEPTIRWTQAKIFMDYAYSLKKNVRFNMISNGIRFLDNDFVRDFISNSHYKEGRFDLDVSFDGLRGNIERIYHDGKESTNDVLEVLFKLKELNISYRLRYTVHSLNINVFEDDLMKIIKFFNPERIILNENWNSLSSEEILKLNKIKNKLIGLYYNKDIEVPICMKNDEMCTICNKCVKNPNDISLYLGDKKMSRKRFEIGQFKDF